MAFSDTIAGKILNTINPFNRPVDVQKNLAGYIAPVQLERLKQDIQSWREAIKEAENAWYPQRVRMQKIFVDTMLNGHVSACVERRKDLTLLRKFCLTSGNPDSLAVFCDIVEKDGEQIATPKKWLSDFISYSLDALFYGYSLVALGDIIDGEFQKLTPIKRWNVSPDRRNVTKFTYAIAGKPFDDEDVKDWHVYIDTPNEIGASPCGYGIFYKVANYEIILRNLLGFNADFVEVYAQPYRVGKTMKTAGIERDMFEAAVRDMGSNGYAITDPQDQIEFLETALGGTGYKGYDNLEARCEKKISKLILGHADALDSIPGKLGNNSEKSPAQLAMEDKASKDGTFIENIINKELIPRLVNLGFNVPMDEKFMFLNDAEQEEIRNNQDKQNAAVATIAQTMKNAGLKMDAKYFEERTGIPTTEIVAPAPIVQKPDPQFKEPIKNKLEKLYAKHKVH